MPSRKKMLTRSAELNSKLYFFGVYIIIMDVTAIIAAAGQGLRMESATRKQYLFLEKVPVLARSLNLFLENNRVGEVIAVIPPGEKADVQVLLQPYCPIERIRLVDGGTSRQESIERGLEAIPEQAVLVCIHDAARPLASAALLATLLDAAEEWGAAIPALPLTDTVKEVDREGLVLATPDRETLRLVQTPQVFHKEVITAAYKEARNLGLKATDDASLVEAMKSPVKTVPGEAENLKITSPRDLDLAALIIKETGV